MQKKIIEIQERVKEGKPVEGEYLTHLLVSEQMSVTEILGSITELLLAGVDTVNIFTLYLRQFIFSFNQLINYSTKHTVHRVYAGCESPLRICQLEWNIIILLMNLHMSTF